MSLEFHGDFDRSLDRDIECNTYEGPPACERCSCDLRSSSEMETGICDLCMTFLRLEPRET